MNTIIQILSQDTLKQDDYEYGDTYSSLFLEDESLFLRNHQKVIFFAWNFTNYDHLISSKHDDTDTCLIAAGP